MVLTVARRHEKGWEFPDVRRLPAIEHRHDARPLLDSADCRPDSTFAREEDFREGRPRQGIPPDSRWPQRMSRRQPS